MEPHRRTVCGSRAVRQRRFQRRGWSFQQITQAHSTNWMATRNNQKLVMVFDAISVTSGNDKSVEMERRLLLVRGRGESGRTGVLICSGTKKKFPCVVGAVCVVIGRGVT